MKRIVKKLSLVILSTLCINLSAYAAVDNSDVAKISKNTGLNPNVVELALKAKQWATTHTHTNQDLLAIVDYAQPAIDPRLYVINLKTDELLMKMRVAHGKNSGAPNGIPQNFSNQPQSLESSLGVFVTGDTYDGKHGESRRLIGLEQGINNNAEERDIIIHQAAYVNSSFVGRSWGCLAVNPSQAPQLINTLVAGTVIFAYAPQENKDPNLQT